METKKKKIVQKPFRDKCFQTEKMTGLEEIPDVDTNQKISINGKLHKLSTIKLFAILGRQSQVLSNAE